VKAEATMLAPEGGSEFSGDSYAASGELDVGLRE
jgi:hypothetical protein